MGLDYFELKKCSILFFKAYKVLMEKGDLVKEERMSLTVLKWKWSNLDKFDSYSDLFSLNEAHSLLKHYLNKDGFDSYKDYLLSVISYRNKLL